MEPQEEGEIIKNRSRTKNRSGEFSLILTSRWDVFTPRELIDYLKRLLGICELMLGEGNVEMFLGEYKKEIYKAPPTTMWCLQESAERLCQGLSIAVAALCEIPPYDWKPVHKNLMSLDFDVFAQAIESNAGIMMGLEPDDDTLSTTTITLSYMGRMPNQVTLYVRARANMALAKALATHAFAGCPWALYKKQLITK
jgi:hypothetical protein